MLEFDGDGGFARCGKACEPDCQATLAAEAGAFVAGERGGVVGYVAVDELLGGFFFSFSVFFGYLRLTSPCLK